MLAKVAGRPTAARRLFWRVRSASVQWPAALGQTAGTDHADGHGLAVEVDAVAGGGFDGVPDGVAVVEDGADAAVLGILIDHLRLPAHAALDELGEERGIVQPVG